MPEPKPSRKGAAPKKKQFEAQADSFLDALRIAPNEPEEHAPEKPGLPAGAPAGKPAVVSKLIDYIKKM